MSLYQSVAWWTLYESGCNVVLVLHTPVTVLSLYVGTARTVTIGVTLQADRTLRVAVTGCASSVGEPIVIGLTLVTLESCHAWTTLALTRDLVTYIAQ